MSAASSRIVAMSIPVRSFAKINIGLCIGPKREDGFHQLRTVYQTLELHDVVRVCVDRGTGIEIRCKDERVPEDESNTCWRIAERVLRALKTRGKIVISIEKQLPVQGGLGAASSNAIATMFGLERALKQQLPAEERLRIASEVGSDLPLFLVGGTVLGTGRGEQVFPLQDLPPEACVVVTPAIGVSTPQAFADWDALSEGNEKTHISQNQADVRHQAKVSALTRGGCADRISKFSQSIFAWLTSGTLHTGVPAVSGDRAGNLSDLVRAGIENDFERVVFPQHSELREAKRALEREGARYASLSGSGSTLYGLFDSDEAAQQAAKKLGDSGLPAIATRTLTRAEYWKKCFKTEN
jgi:4-diphosphocytidyl-2-C-methyl-D-erythritol kinase